MRLSNIIAIVSVTNDLLAVIYTLLSEYKHTVH